MSRCREVPFFISVFALVLLLSGKNEQAQTSNKHAQKNSNPEKKERKIPPSKLNVGQFFKFEVQTPSRCISRPVLLHFPFYRHLYSKPSFTYPISSNSILNVSDFSALGFRKCQDLQQKTLRQGMFFWLGNRSFIFSCKITSEVLISTRQSVRCQLMARTAPAQGECHLRVEEHGGGRGELHL